jgi:plasmid stabilization system protein ParE
VKLLFHPSVYSDIEAIMEYYENAASEVLANEFYHELKAALLALGARPESFSIRERDIRRVNLERFPYHFLFRIVGDTVRILVVRHHHKQPSFGIRRR